MFDYRKDFNNMVGYETTSEKDDFIDYLQTRLEAAESELSAIGEYVPIEKLKEAEAKLEEVRQIINRERHELINKDYLWGLNEKETKKLEYFTKIIKKFWPRFNQDDEDKLKELLKKKQPRRNDGNYNQK